MLATGGFVVAMQTSLGSTKESKPLPAVPKMVSELHLPEEQQAAGAAYRIYSGLPAEELGKLYAGGRSKIDAEKLSPQMRSIYAAWFNSARWGCQPPAEKIDANAVAKSQLVFAGKGGVIDLCLQSPQKRIWKRLTIACSKEKAEWVRDGLPLLPVWLGKAWEGTTHPPAPKFEGKYGFEYHDWSIARGWYRIYAGLPAASLRKLHQSNVLEIRFADLPRTTQQSLADTCYELRYTRRFTGAPDSDGDPEWLRKRLYGITRIKFFYMRRSGGYQIGPETATFLRPYRAVSMITDALHPPPEYWSSGKSREDLPPSKWVRFNLAEFKGPGELIAWPAEMQRKALDWRRRRQVWSDKWMEKLPQGGAMSRPGAPPAPEPPWTYDK